MLYNYIIHNRSTLLHNKYANDTILKLVDFKKKSNLKNEEERQSRTEI